MTDVSDFDTSGDISTVKIDTYTTIDYPTSTSGVPVPLKGDPILQMTLNVNVSIMLEQIIVSVEVNDD
jgi:hypothetical protein